MTKSDCSKCKSVIDCSNCHNCSELINKNLLSNILKIKNNIIIQMRC